MRGWWALVLARGKWLEQFRMAAYTIEHQNECPCATADTCPRNLQAELRLPHHIEQRDARYLKMACDVWNLGILGFSGYDARGLLEGQYRIAVCLGGSNQPRIGDVKLRPKAQGSIVITFALLDICQNLCIYHGDLSVVCWHDA